MPLPLAPLPPSFLIPIHSFVPLSAVVVAQFSREVVVIVLGHSLSITVNLYKFSGCLALVPAQASPSAHHPTPFPLVIWLKLSNAGEPLPASGAAITFGPVNARSTQIWAYFTHKHRQKEEQRGDRGRESETERVSEKERETEQGTVCVSVCVWVVLARVHSWVNFYLVHDGPHHWQLESGWIVCVPPACVSVYASVRASMYVRVFSTNLLSGVFIALVVVSYFSSEKF